MLKHQADPTDGQSAGRSPLADTPLPDGIHRLGEALNARTDAVLARTVTRTRESDRLLEAVVEESFEQICSASTSAVAGWMAGQGTEDAIETGQEVWRIFGQLAAQRLAPLNEVTKRCLRWRDSTAEVLTECAAELQLVDVLPQALAMLNISLDMTLVRMCECFETERQHADEELARRQEELAFLATHDTVTGLPNRTLILDRVEQMLVRSRRNQTPVAALFIDLDNFKGINDTLGHGAGDELLKAVSSRLGGVVRETDALGRLGGDEFVVIAEGMSLAAGPELVAERLLEALKEPFKLADGQSRLTVTASIGIAMGERASGEELLRDADIAMYRAKWDGKNRYVVFEAGMQDLVQTNTELEMDLRDAIECEEFVLVYQPTFDMRDMRPTGMEALIRWNSPKRGLVQPNDFIPLLEETGLIVDVGRWVLREACRQCATWRTDGYEIGIAVNVSARQLDSDAIIDDVREALAQNTLDPQVLTLEITETTLMRDIDQTARRLAEIKQLGVRIAIDDFGTGYSSIGHLQKFPVDAVKIDRSFISALKDNEEGETLIRTLVQLGKALSIETLAEGIEEPHELSILQAHQCDSGQGFLYARPSQVSDIDTFLASWAQGATALEIERRQDALA